MSIFKTIYFGTNLVVDPNAFPLLERDHIRQSRRPSFRVLTIVPKPWVLMLERGRRLLVLDAVQALPNRPKL